MAQLKVKQISDFVAVVGSIHNATVGTAAGSAIGTAKTEAIAAAAVAAEAKDVLRASTAVVNISTAKSEAIASAEAKDVLRASTAVVNISTAKSEAISSAVSADVVVLSSAKKYADDKDVIALTAAKSYSDIQKIRIDALLKDSTAALDTFAEIETFITGLSTADVSQLQALSTAVSNDVVHASGISANSTAIANLDLDFSGDFDALGAAAAALVSAKTYADTAESDAITSAKSYADGLAVNYDAAGNAAAALVSAKTYADTAESDAIASAKSYADGLAVNYDAAGNAAAALVSAKTYADTAESDAIASANGYTNTSIAALDLDLQGQIDALAGVNSDEVVAVFGSATEFSTTRQFALNGHVVVFVNGLQIHEAAEGIDGWRSLNGRDFTVEGLGYELEADDHIIISGTVA